MEYSGAIEVQNYLHKFYEYIESHEMFTNLNCPLFVILDIIKYYKYDVSRSVGN